MHRYKGRPRAGVMDQGKPAACAHRPRGGTVWEQMRTFESLRAEVLELFTRLSDIAAARGAEEAARRLAAGKQRLLDERLVVVVCGEFKRGKSTLLNALLGDRGLFPVDAFYATRVITTAAYGHPKPSPSP